VTATNLLLTSFLPHAVSFWPMYLEKEPGDPEYHIDSKTRGLLQEFFATSKQPKGGAYASWVGFLIAEAPLNFIENTRPLYYAASFGLTEVVRIILETEKDLDINALGGRANASALHAAVYRDHYDVVKLLLEHGADPNLPNYSNESPLYWAHANANDEMEELLFRYGATTTKRSLSRSAVSNIILDHAWAAGARSRGL